MKKALLAMVLLGRCGTGPGTPDGGSPDAGRPIDAAVDTSHPGDAAVKMDGGFVDSGTDAAQDAAASNLDAAGTADAGDAGGPAICEQPSPDKVWGRISSTNGPSAVEAIAPGEIWGTALGKLFRWNGSGWSAVSVPFTWSTLAAGVVRGTDANDVWVTNGSTTVFRWDGTTWTDMSPPPPPSYAYLTQMRVIGPADVWALLNSAVDTSIGQLLTTSPIHWNGTSWTEVPVPVDSQSVIQLSSLWATSSSDVWFGGQGILPATEPLLFHWDGATVSPVPFGPFPEGGSQFIASLWSGKPDDVWVGGGSSMGAKLNHFDGTSWTEFPFPGVGGEVSAVWGWCDTNLWASTGDGMQHFDGATWTRFPSPLFNPNELSGTGPDDAWVSGTGSSSFVLHWQANSCGDGVIGPGETCDPPRGPGSGGPLCDSTCQIPTCGNLTIDPGEACDPPDDTTCDRTCQAIPIVCGNGITQPGEACDFPATSPQLCQNCQLTNCGDCFVSVGANAPTAASLCAGLDTADTVSCNDLVSCVAAGIGRCTTGMFGAYGCLCSNPASSCAAGIDGPCGSIYEALAHSADPAVIISLIGNRTTTIGRISAAAVTFAGTCGSTCSRQM